jgi:formylmethanofuran dehydrogenase subunit B
VADFGPVTCAGCGLLCDDVTVERPNGDVRLQPPCRLGLQWFSERLERPARAPAMIRGQPADVETALTRAAGLLRRSHRPLLYGFEAATVEDARAAVALADRLEALIATESVSASWPGAPAVPLRGTSTATLGEIRDRSRLVIIWREDPETTHPRLMERIGFEGGVSSRLGAERTLLVVDDRETSTSRRADLQLRWARERDLDALTTLHVMQRRLRPPRTIGAELVALLEHINGVPHIAFVYGGGLTNGPGGQRRALALHELVRALCHERHVVTLALSSGPGTTGAQDVLAWQTGYAPNVDLASGHPELVTATRPLAADEDVDVALRIEGAHAPLPAGVAEIALCSAPAGPDVDVSIRTAAAGVEAAGTAHRLDGVPLTLQAPLACDAPTAAALLTRLLAEIER